MRSHLHNGVGVAALIVGVIVAWHAAFSGGTLDMPWYLFNLLLTAGAVFSLAWLLPLLNGDAVAQRVAEVIAQRATDDYLRGVNDAAGRP